MYCHLTQFNFPRRFYVCVRIEFSKIILPAKLTHCQINAIFRTPFRIKSFLLKDSDRYETHTETECDWLSEWPCSYFRLQSYIIKSKRCIRMSIKIEIIIKISALHTYTIMSRHQNWPSQIETVACNSRDNLWRIETPKQSCCYQHAFNHLSNFYLKKKYTEKERQSEKKQYNCRLAFDYVRLWLSSATPMQYIQNIEK